MAECGFNFGGKGRNGGAPGGRETLAPQPVVFWLSPSSSLASECAAMTLLADVMEHDARWVEERHRPLTKAPQKRVVISTCVDTRLVDFLEPALGLRRGDA